MKQKQPGKADAYYGSSAFYVPDPHQTQHGSPPRMHRRKRGCLLLLLVLALVVGSWMWYQSQQAARGNIIPPSLNTPFSLAHPIASLQARAVSYTHLRAHETRHDLVCRLL